MIIVDVIVAASAALVFGVVVITAKFSREMPINKGFDELWFENLGHHAQQELEVNAVEVKTDDEESALAKAA